MADQIIEIPGVGQVAFPESMSPDDISSAAHRLYLDAQYQANSAAANRPNTEMKAAEDRLSTEMGVAPDVPWQKTAKANAIAAGTVGALGAGAVLAPGVGPAIGRILTHPVTGGVTGAYYGYKGGGIPGALAGGVLGALEGPALGQLGRAGRLLTKAAPAAAEAVPAAAATVETLIKSPAALAAEDQLLKLAKMEAMKRGLLSAAGQAAKAWPK